MIGSRLKVTSVFKFISEFAQINNLFSHLNQHYQFNTSEHLPLYKKITNEIEVKHNTPSYFINSQKTTYFAINDENQYAPVQIERHNPIEKSDEVSHYFIANNKNTSEAINVNPVSVSQHNVNPNTLYQSNEKMHPQEKFTEKLVVEEPLTHTPLTVSTFENILLGTEVDDRIKSEGDNFNTRLLGGNDSFWTKGINNFADLGDGNDSISIIGTKNAVYTQQGDDSITATGRSHFIDLGDGNDSINATGHYMTILGQSGQDTIRINGYYHQVNGGSGHDKIEIGYGYNIVIDGGSDDDIVNAAKATGKIEFTDGSGNDIYYGSPEQDIVTWYFSENKNNLDVFDGNTGENTIILNFTQDEINQLAQRYSANSNIEFEQRLFSHFDQHIDDTLSFEACK